MKNQLADNYISYLDPIELYDEDCEPISKEKLLSEESWESTQQKLQQTMDFDENNSQYFQNYLPYQQSQSPVEERLENSEESYQPSYTTSDSPNSYEADPKIGISEKSKRIQKRDVAKKRTKQRKGEEFLAEVDPKHIPPEFYDPDLDEKERKKLLQKIRNRASAQNSRDKKKGYLESLEKQVKILNNEVYNLKKRNTQLEEVVEKYKRRLEENQCLKCGQSSPTYFPSTEATSEDVGSPISRGSSRCMNFRGSKLTMGLLTLLGVITTVCIVSPDNSGNFGGSSKIQPTRLLAEASNLTLLPRTPATPTSMVIAPSKIYDGPFSYQVVGSARDNFQEHHESTYSSSSQKLFFTDKENKTKEIQEDFGRTQLGYQATSQFLSKPNIVTASSVRIIDSLPEGIEEESITSTVFCPYLIEFNDIENIKSGVENSVRTNLEQAQYIQLLIPKRNIRSSSLNENQNPNGGPLPYGDEEDGKMLELWLKPFFIRELGAPATKL